MERAIHETLSYQINSSSLQRGWEKGLVQHSLRWDFKGEEESEFSMN